MHKILGIDLGASQVKAVAIEANFRAHELRAYRSEPLSPRALPPPAPPDGAQGDVPPPEPQTYAQRVRPVLESFAQDDWFAADAIVCCLPGAQVATHFVSLPFGNPKQVEATLSGEIEGLIPFDLEDVVYDAHVVSRTPTRTELLVGVARKEDVKAVLDALAAVGVDPSVVTFSSVALANLYGEGYLGAPPQDGATGSIEAIVDIGDERTSVLLVDGGAPQFARTFSAAGGDVTRALSRGLGLPLDAADEAKRSLNLMGGDGDPTLVTVAERAIAPIIRELRATFASYQGRTRRKVERVILTGGGSLLGGLAASISSSLGVGVEQLRLNDGRTFPEEGRLDEGALALALALRGLNGRNAPRMNFRKGEFAFTKAVGEARGKVVALVAMAATIAILLGVGSWARVRALEKREAQIDDLMCETTKRILGKCENDYRVALARLKGRGSPAASVPMVSAVDLALEVTRAFPPGDDAILSDVDISDNEVRLRGDAKGFDVVDVLVGELKKNECFTEVRKGKLTKTKDNRVDFDLDATYACPQAKKAGT